MPAPALPFVEPADIVGLTGADAFEHAREYATGGAVRELDWDGSTFRLVGAVRGAVAEPYRCRIELAPGREGRCRVVGSTCTCAARFDCAHVAAVLLAANETIRLGLVPVSDVSPAEPRGDRGAPGDPEAPGARGTRGDRGARGDGDAAGWRAALDPLAAGVPSRAGAGPANGGRTRAGTRPLAVVFEVREVVRRHRGPWQTAASSTVAAGPGSARDLRLTARPAIRSETGRWVSSGVGWGSLYHQVHRLNLDDRQVSWFTQFAALGRPAQGVFIGQDPDRLALDDFESTLLWQLLADAKRVGVELVSNKNGGAVVLADRARAGLEASEGPGGSLVLRTFAEFDGHEVAPGSIRTIGTHGLYAVEWSPALRVTLGPLANRAGSDLSPLLHRESVTIPPAEVAEFMRDYYPALARRLDVVRARGALTLPELAPPSLVGTARFDTGHRLELSWEWEYPIPDGAVRLPAGEAATHSPAGAAAVRPVAATAARDLDAEADILNRLGDVLASSAADPGTDELEAAVLTGVPPAGSWSGFSTVDIARRVLPAMEAVVGVRIEIIGERPDYRELQGRPELRVKTVETDQHDWFDLGILVSVDGHDIPFGPLFAALSKGQPKLLLTDRSFLSLKQPVFDRLRELIEEAGELAEWETRPRISRYQASLWSEFEDLADESEEATSWRETVRGLRVLDGAAGGGAAAHNEPLPAGLDATLRPYQHDGYQWLAFLWRHGLGGILADDMGLGKTLQTLAVIARGVESGQDAAVRPRYLVVAPTSVVSNWVSEAARFTPSLRVAAVTATRASSRVPLASLWKDADVVVTSYALFRLDFDHYQAGEWAGLVLDEAQFVKNRATKAHQCAREFRAPFKLAITGTPLENDLLDLWSLFAIVAPGLFPSVRRFTEQYLRPVEHDRSRGDAAALIDRLRRRVRPLMLRRTKEAVAPELPPKTEQVLRIDLAPAHRRLYDTFLQKERQKLLGLIDDLDRNRFTVFRSLTLLRMLSLDASLLDDDYQSVPSRKLDALLEQLDDVLAEGHRALVFSQFTSFLRKVADRLDRRDVPYAYLDGTTTRRADAIRTFTSGDAPLFLISLKAGGFGLNLTEADYVFLLDPWWNPAAEAQAVDRAHRIGQDKRVMVYRMVSSGTIEEKVLALGERKARLFDAVMGDGAFDAAITAEDIRGLLED
jgi:superfamily II DNA or RNA helicase